MKRERPLEFLSRTMRVPQVAFGVIGHASVAVGLYQRSVQHGSE